MVTKAIISDQDRNTIMEIHVHVAALLIILLIQYRCKHTEYIIFKPVRNNVEVATIP